MLHEATYQLQWHRKPTVYATNAQANSLCYKEDPLAQETNGFLCYTTPKTPNLDNFSSAAAGEVGKPRHRNSEEEIRKPRQQMNPQGWETAPAVLTVPFHIYIANTDNPMIFPPTVFLL